MKLREILNFLKISIVGFTFAHGLLFLLIFKSNNLYDQILYHYSESIYWYLIYFIFPFAIGIIFYFLIKQKTLSRVTQLVFSTILILQICITIICAFWNYKYWGYSFRRPTVFNEISKTKEILTCTSVSNIDSIGISKLQNTFNPSEKLDELFGRIDMYYGKFDRPFMVLQDISHLNGQSGDFNRVFKDQNKKLSPTILKVIEQKIKDSECLDYRSYNNYPGALFGLIFEFRTIHGEKFLHAGLNGGEVSNDHFPFYEFLFIDHNGVYQLIGKQRFYTDVAGIEGLEIGNFGPFLSFSISSMGLLSLLLFKLFRRIFKNNNAL